MIIYKCCNYKECTGPNYSLGLCLVQNGVVSYAVTSELSAMPSSLFSLRMHIEFKGL